MLFDTCGPFNYNRVPDEQWRSRFWEEVDEFWDGLSGAIGCYAFCMSHGRSRKPWYIGKTTCRAGFRGEIFQQHKLDKYDEIIARKPRHSADIFLFPLLKNDFQLSFNRSSHKSTIDWLENVMIGMSLASNPDIANVGKTKLYREVYVNGVIGDQYTGRPRNSARLAKAMFIR